MSGIVRCITPIAPPLVNAGPCEIFLTLTRQRPNFKKRDAQTKRRHSLRL